MLSVEANVRQYVQILSNAYSKSNEKIESDSKLVANCRNIGPVSGQGPLVVFSALVIMNVYSRRNSNDPFLTDKH